MSLLDDVRGCLRVTSSLTDAEIQMWIDAALADMRRCGVKAELLVPETMNSLAKSAVACFVKGHYGYDNNEAPRFLESYRMMLAGLLNSRSNEYIARPEDDAKPEGESDEEPPDGGTDDGADDEGTGEGGDG